MATGTTSSIAHTTAVELFSGVAAANGAPTLATDGVSVAALVDGNGLLPSVVSVLLKSTAGTGVMTATARVWLYSPVAAAWVPYGIGAGATKGYLNAGATIDEHATDSLAHAEPINRPSHFTRIYLEVVAIAGTGTTLSAWLVSQI